MPCPVPVVRVIEVFEDARTRSHRKYVPHTLVATQFLFPNLARSAGSIQWTHLRMTCAMTFDVEREPGRLKIVRQRRGTSLAEAAVPTCINISDGAKIPSLLRARKVEYSSKSSYGKPNSRQLVLSALWFAASSKRAHRELLQVVTAWKDLEARSEASCRRNGSTPVKSNKILSEDLTSM